MKRETLARYPYPIVRVACRYCKRRGRYRLESLVATYGPDTTFEQLLTRLSADCALSSNRTNRPDVAARISPTLKRNGDATRAGQTLGRLEKSSLSRPSCTIRIAPAGYSRASANASSADPRSHVSNSSSRVSNTGMRS